MMRKSLTSSPNYFHEWQKGRVKEEVEEGMLVVVCCGVLIFILCYLFYVSYFQFQFYVFVLVHVVSCVVGCFKNFDSVMCDKLWYCKTLILLMVLWTSFSFVIYWLSTRLVYHICHSLYILHLVLPIFVMIEMFLCRNLVGNCWPKGPSS